MGDVVALRERSRGKPAPTMALFASCDADPGFVVELCTDDDLRDAIARAFGVEAGDIPGTDMAREIDESAAWLREHGDLTFEDGWMVLAKGFMPTVEFLMVKVRALAADVRCEDERRFAEYQRANAAEERYRQLAGALAMALGSDRESIAALVGG